MKFLHSMVRVKDLDASLEFYCNQLGLVEISRRDYETARFTLIFLAAPGDESRGQIELTWNWDSEDYGTARNFGHLAFAVEDIHATCQRLMDAGITINRPPHGLRAFTGSDLDRTAAEGPGPGTVRAMVVDAEYRGVVTMLFASSRHPGESRDPFCCCCQFNMDSGFRRNDELQAMALIEQYWVW